MYPSRTRLSSLLVILAIICASTPASAADVDADGLDDDWERLYFENIQAQTDTGDPDRDGLDNAREQAIGTNPMAIDTDGDYLRDNEELQHQTDPVDPDTDADGLTDAAELRATGTNPLVADTDSGGSIDGAEVQVDGTDPLVPNDDQLDQDQDGLTFYEESRLGTNDVAVDTDADGLADGIEDANHDGVVAFDSNGDGIFQPADGEETDPSKPDTDADGLADGWELNAYDTDPYVSDTDGDGLTDGQEHRRRRGTDPCLDPAVADSDYDGLSDYDEINTHGSDPCAADSDGDGIYDVVEVFDGTNPTAAGSLNTDTDGDGLSDTYERSSTGPYNSQTDAALADSDGDQLSDAQEALPLSDGLQTDPLDGDTDDDGLLDGREPDSNPTAADTDGDGLLDGVEVGLTSPQVASRDPDATDSSVFVADADPATQTEVDAADTDDDGQSDGLEDANRNGRVDSGETNPDRFDTDDDGMDDGWEARYHNGDHCEASVNEYLDPLDATDADSDPDHDGLTSVREYRVTWKDDSGEVLVNRTNPCKADTDSDNLDDGTEVTAHYGVLGPSNPRDADTDGDRLSDGAEDTNADGQWQFDTETNPLNPDTDGDRQRDGDEDTNHNGQQDSGETDPLDADTDGDGLPDGTEVDIIGSDPLAVDSDGDGLSDGLEAGVTADADTATQTDPTRGDTDNDGLTDGAEDRNANGRTDPGEPDPNVADSDGDGLVDGDEDTDGDGAVDAGETDPLAADTDGGGVPDNTEIDAHGTDPRDPLDDWTADPDGDGLTNHDEQLAGTDPRNPDTDGDTISDGDEVGPTPAMPRDTDGDGVPDARDHDSDADTITDRDETDDGDWHTAPLDTDRDGRPDYRDEDADNGGVPDQIEVSVHRSDPQMASDDGVGWFEGPVTGGAGCSSADAPTAPLGGSNGIPWGLLGSTIGLLAAMVWRRRAALPNESASGVLTVLATVVTTGFGGGMPSADAAEHPDARHTDVRANTFRVDPSGKGLLATTVADPLAHLGYRVSATVHYLNRPLVVRPGINRGSERPLVDDRLQVDAAGAVGLYRYFELGVVVPTTPHQTAQYPGFGLGSVDSAGLGNVEVYAKAAALSADTSAVGLAVQVPVELPTASAAYLGAAGVVVHPQLVVSSQLGPVVVAINAGASFRRKTELFKATAGRKLTVRTGAMWRSPTWGFGAEFVGATALNHPLNNPYESRGEIVIGGRYSVSSHVELIAGAGRGVIRGIGAAAFRSFLNLAYHTDGSGDPCTDPPGGSFAAMNPRRCPDLDFDADGLANRSDDCPRAPEDVDQFRDGDGCPDRDNDGDQIVDTDDQCPNSAEDQDGFADHDGCPDDDNDEDGLADDQDWCPNTPETINDFEDEDGCPDTRKAPQVTVKQKRLDISAKFYFETDRAVLKKSSFPLLDEIGRTLNEHPELELVEIQGFADTRGPSEYNYYLSWERAKVVRYYLIDQAGIPPQRLRAAGFGDFTAATHEENVDLAKQRRVQFEILKRVK